jgi:hypothetical protein
MSMSLAPDRAHLGYLAVGVERDCHRGIVLV